MNYSKSTLSGVGGWLGLLIFGLVIGGPFIRFSGLLPLKEAEEINPSLINNPAWQNYTQIFCNSGFNRCSRNHVIKIL